jgi:mono/diheme cytochrome c family protein
MLRTSLLAALLLSACAGDSSECAVATEKVAACYGEEVATAFADACDPAAAELAMAEQCPSDVEGKADGYSPPILSPATEHFKYGSIGADKMGVPVSILKAIPLVCADTLPPGTNPKVRPLTAFGFIYEAGKDLPIGFSRNKLPLIGMELAGTTCSTCHTATIRETPTSGRFYYYGAPNQRFDVEGWNDFLLGCINDPKRFNATTLDRAFRELGVSGTDRLLAFSSSFLRAFTSDLKEKVESVVSDGAWGPGRDDAIGLSAAILLGEEHLPTVPAPIDYPSVWNQNARKGHSLHWDGASGSAFERNVLVSVGAGTPEYAVPIQSINAIQGFLDQLPAPKYPYTIDQTIVPRGRELFDNLCNSCHGATGSRLFQVVDLFEIGTDPNRVNVVTQAGIDEMNSMSGPGWQFDSFKKTNGYLNSPLDGIWLRAPYLHNGSVPTLRDLLKPAAQRPTTFFRGNDTYDKVNVGFVSNLATEGSTRYMQFETARAGNANTGHEYGTSLSTADQDALLEYLKTL